jgi:hypothetical protein
MRSMMSRARSTPGAPRNIVKSLLINPAPENPSPSIAEAIKIHVNLYC